jgi:hypothetical protein
LPTVKPVEVAQKAGNSLLNLSTVTFSEVVCGEFASFVCEVEVHLKKLLKIKPLF